MIKKISFGFLVAFAFIGSAFFFRAEQTAQATTNYCTTNFSINQCLSQLFSQQAHATPNYCTPQYGVNQCLNQIFPGGIFSLIVGTTPITNGTNGDCLYDNAGILGEQSCGGGGGGTPANPTATAGPAAVNGVLTTYMRSDAAPAIQLGSSAQFGIVEVDNTTITASGGVISAVAQTGAVSSVSGATGQITVSPTTGAVVVSLPTRITQTENFSAVGHVFGAINTGVAPVTITTLTGTLPTPVSNAGILMVGQGGSNPGAYIDAYNYAGAGPEYNMNYAAGTLASPLAAISGHVIGQFNYNAYNGSVFVNGAEFLAQAQGGWSGSNQGTLFEWITTPINTTTLTTVMVLYQGLWVGSGVGSSDPGIGVVEATNGVIIGAGSAITSSGAGGALGTNAFNSTAYAPLASPTFTGTVNASAINMNTGNITALSLLQGASNNTFTVAAAGTGVLALSTANLGGSNVVGNVTINAGNGTGATNNGGSIVLTSGTTVGGAAGTLQFKSAVTLYNQPTTGTITYAVCAAANANGSTGGALILDTSSTVCGLVSAKEFKNQKGIVETADAAAAFDRLPQGAPIWEYKSVERRGKIHVGLYADDVEKLDPRCVIYDPKTLKVQNYEDRCVIAYLVAKIQNMERAGK